MLNAQGIEVETLNSKLILFLFDRRAPNLTVKTTKLSLNI